MFQVGSLNKQFGWRTCSQQSSHTGSCPLHRPKAKPMYVARGGLRKLGEGCSIILVAFPRPGFFPAHITYQRWSRLFTASHQSWYQTQSLSAQGRVCAGVEACERRCVQPAGVERAACTGGFRLLSLGDQGETPFWDGRGDRQSLLGCLEWTTASCPGRPLHVHILEHPSPSTTVCQKLTTGPELRP